MKKYVLVFACFLFTCNAISFGKNVSNDVFSNRKKLVSSHLQPKPGALQNVSPKRTFKKSKPRKKANDGTALYFADFKKSLPAADFINPGGWIAASGGITSTKTGLGNYLMLNRQYNVNKRKAAVVFTIGADTKFNFIAQEIENTHVWGSMVQIDVPNKMFHIFKPYDSDKKINPEVAIEHPYTFIAGHEYGVEMARDDFSNVFIVTDISTALSDTIVDSENKTGLMRDGFAIATESGTPPIIQSFRVSTSFKPGVYILYVGDSITEGMYSSADAQSDDAEKLGGSKSRVVAVSGRSGGRVAGVQNRLLSEIRILKPKYVSILIGTNGTNTVENLTELCKGIKKAGAIPILNNIPWRRTGGTVEDNAIISTVRKNLHLNGAAFDKATSVGELNAEEDFSLFNDGIHPNAAGAKKIFARFKTDVPEMFKK